MIIEHDKVDLFCMVYIDLQLVYNVEGNNMIQ